MNKINNKVYLFQVFSSYSGFNFFSHNPNCTSGTQYSSFGPVVCIVKPKKKKKIVIVTPYLIHSCLQ